MKVLLVILAVLAAIIALIVVLLHFSVKAYVEADKKHLDLVVKYLGIKLYSLSLPDKEKEPEAENPPNDDDVKDDDSEPEIVLSEVPAVDSTDEAEREEIIRKIEESSEKSDDNEEHEDVPEPAESSENSEEKEEPDEPKPTLLEKWNEYKKYIPAGKKAFRKLLKLIRFYDLGFSLTLGNEDPYKAGLNYGRINAAVYSVLGLLCSIFSVTIDHTEIKCDFENKAFDFDFKTAVFVRPSAVVALAVYLGVYYLKIRRSSKKLENIAKAKENVQ